MTFFNELLDEMGENYTIQRAEANNDTDMEARIWNSFQRTRRSTINGEEITG
jgi:hypothetical protein